jgi:Zn-dependent protease
LIDFTLSQLVMRACAVLFVSTLHGFALAVAACALGDQGPRHDGRLTLDPLRQIDLGGGVVGLIFSIGWAKWVAIDPRALRHGRLGLVLVVVAGTAAILLGVLALELVRPVLLPWLPDTVATATFALIQTTMETSLWFALFGLIPIPPLAGGHLLIAALPGWRDRLVRIGLFLGLVLAMLVASGLATRVLDPIYQSLARLVLGEGTGM